MGIQILNKDVSVISGVMGKAKASIGNIFGKTGWAGGGGSTPSPTPNWADIAYYDGSALYIYSKQQIQGIGSSITLNITWPGSNELWYLVSTTQPSWSNGGNIFGSRPVDNGFTLITTGANIVVSNNQWVSFATEWGYLGFTPPVPNTTTATVKNVSDSNTTLDTFTITGTS